MPKPILCLDFDGVCHSYVSGWQGIITISDPPVDGLWIFLEEASKTFTLQVYSSRSHQEGGIEAMINWFSAEAPYHRIHQYGDRVTWDFPGITLTFPLEKPPAMLTLDDRALLFTGRWPDVSRLQAFQPWTRTGASPDFFTRLHTHRLLLAACRQAYRKHVQNDETIGWTELSEHLELALMETMGAPAFSAWVTTASAP